MRKNYVKESLSSKTVPKWKKNDKDKLSPFPQKSAE
jgi:hypothetical protein